MSGNTPNVRDPEGRGEKCCTGCEVYLPLDRYGIKTTRKDGSPVWQTRCAPCRKRQQNDAQARRSEMLKNSTSPVDLEPAVHLPIGPLRDWLTRRLSTGEIDHATLSVRMGCDQRQISRWLSEQKTVALDVLDAALCRLGDPALLRELYPELYDFGEEGLAA